MTIQAHIAGDKFIRTIETMETGELTAKRLYDAGYDSTYYLAKRPYKRGNSEMVAMVIRNRETGEYVSAI